MSLVRFDPNHYLSVIRNVETVPIILGTLVTPTLHYFGMGTGLDAVEYYGEVHMSRWNSIMHTMGMPFTSYGFVLAIPSLFNLEWIFLKLFRQQNLPEQRIYRGVNMPPFNIKEFLIIILDGEVCLANSKLNKLILAEDKFNEELEDKILSLSEQDYADEPDQEISLSFKQEMSLGGNKPKMEIESAPDIHKEEILEIVRDAHSGLFYKIENHLNILSLSSHFLEWKEKGKNFFSFYSFLKEESSLSSLLALAAFFEHKENFKTLILCSDLGYVEKIGSDLLKDGLVDAVEISSMIHVGNIYDFISSSIST